MCLSQPCHPCVVVVSRWAWLGRCNFTQQGLGLACRCRLCPRDSGRPLGVTLADSVMSDSHGEVPATLALNTQRLEGKEKHLESRLRPGQSLEESGMGINDNS